MSLPVFSNRTLWSIPATPMNELGLDSKLMSTEVWGSASSRLTSMLIWNEITRGTSCIINYNCNHYNINICKPLTGYTHVVLQYSIEFHVDSISDYLAIVLDELYDHVGGGCHGVRGQEPDDGRVLAGVGDLHSTGHDHVTPAQNLVSDVLQTVRRVHLYFDVFVDLNASTPIIVQHSRHRFNQSFVSYHSRGSVVLYNQVYII